MQPPRCVWSIAAVPVPGTNGEVWCQKGIQLSNEKAPLPDYEDADEHITGVRIAEW